MLTLKTKTTIEHICIHTHKCNNAHIQSTWTVVLAHKICLKARSVLSLGRVAVTILGQKEEAKEKYTTGQIRIIIIARVVGILVVV